MKKVMTTFTIILWFFVGVFTYLFWSEHNMPWPIYLLTTGILLGWLFSRIKYYLPLLIVLILLAFVIGYSSYEALPIHSMKWDNIDTIKVVRYTEMGRKEWRIADSEVISQFKEYGRKGTYQMDGPRGREDYYEIHSKETDWHTFLFLGEYAKQIELRPRTDVYFKSKYQNYFQTLMPKIDSIILRTRLMN
jgi:hypothetical protein